MLDIPNVVYDFTPRRTRDGPELLLKEFQEYLQADAFSGYDRICAGPGVKEVACWTNVRRKFFESRTSAPVLAHAALARIRQLYKIETAAEEFAAEDRRALRQRDTVPLLTAFGEWLTEQKRLALPKSPFGQAIAYAQSNWAALRIDPEHGELSIDNNLAEWMLRAQAIGRRNWTFLGSDGGGRTVAVLYSFTGTCRHHDIDPFAYLTDILRRLPSHLAEQLDELVPDLWFRSHPSARRKKAARIGGRILAKGAWPTYPTRIEWATTQATWRAEAAMNTPKPERTIDRIFDEFLADQEARLSSKTLDRYEGIIHLYRSYLECYWPGHSGKESEAIARAKGTYCGTFGAEEITSGFSEFLGYFMPRKVIAGNETIKAAGTVVKKLSRWLVAKGYTEDDESIRDLAGTTARDLPASQKLLDELFDWLSEAGPVRSGNEIEGHFLIQRTGPRQIWLEPMIPEYLAEIGPIPVPANVARAYKVEWGVGGVVGLTNKDWRLVEVWNISP